ncbi:MAG: anti-sigma factor antagonist [Spirochaetia bacterium]
MSNNDILSRFDEDACDSLFIELQKVEKLDTCLALRLTGEIDTYSAPFFQRSVMRAIDAGFVNLIFVLDGVEYVSSKAVGALVQTQKAARDKGGDITLVAVPQTIMEVLKLLCLEKYFCSADSLDEALAQIKNREKALVFPMTFECPICDRRLRALKSGGFRCPECRTVLSIDESGMIFICYG